MSSLQQIANWKSQVNPLEKMYGGRGIAPSIVARPQMDNAMMILVSPDFEEPYKDLRGCYMSRDTLEIRCLKAGTLEGGEYEHELDKNKRAYSIDGASPTIIATTDQKIVELGEPNLHIKTNNSKGYEEAYPGDSVSIAYPTSGTRRGRVGHGQSQTLDTAGGESQGVVEEPKMFIYDAYNHNDISNKEQIGTIGAHSYHGSGNCGTFYIGEQPHYRIRKLTEKECFRLMGVKDEDSALIASHQSKTSQYHLAGDSIVTSCLMAIFGEMCGLDWRSSIDSLVESLTRHSIETEGDVNEYLRGAK